MWVPPKRCILRIYKVRVYKGWLHRDVEFFISSRRLAWGHDKRREEGLLEAQPRINHAGWTGEPRILWVDIHAVVANSAGHVLAVRHGKASIECRGRCQFT